MRCIDNHAAMPARAWQLYDWNPAMPRNISLLLTMLVMIAGCTQQPAPHTNAATPALSNRESQALCLASTGGNSTVELALAHVQSAVRQQPQRPDLWIAVGRGWVRQARLTTDPGFYVNVDACASEALLVNPGFVPALELRSLVLMNNHQFESARVLAEQILAKAPESVIANGTHSDALLELGRYPEAARAAQAQMNAHPGMAASARAAHLNWLKGDVRSAELFIRDALMERNAADPEAAAWAFVEAGMIYWQKGDYAGADALFAEALNWLPDYPAALVGRGRVALARGDADTAIATLKVSLAKRPLVETAWLLGDAYALAGDNAQAKRAYGDAERQGRRGDKFTLALFFASKNRNVDEAVRLLDEERKSRGGIYVDDAYAWALYRAGRMGEAQRMSAQSLRLGTRDARLLFHAGAIELANGERAHGRVLIEQALQLNPGFDLDGAAEARRLLAPVPASVAGN
jgi:tetratricopeptide (TPR) repeat protein